MEKVFVAGHDKDIRPLSRGALRQRPHHIVGFVPFLLNQRKPKRPAKSAHVGKLERQFLRESRTVRLVFFKQLVPKGWSGKVKGHAHVIGPVVFEDLPQRSNEDVNRLGRHAAGRAELHLHGRMERSENQRHGINQDQLLAVLGFGQVFPPGLDVICHCTLSSCKAAPSSIGTRSKSQSFPQKRESTAKAMDPRFRGGDADASTH